MQIANIKSYRAAQRLERSSERLDGAVEVVDALAHVGDVGLGVRGGGGTVASVGRDDAE